MNKDYFFAYCKTIKISKKIASKIINGKYKPYLSAIDSKYYHGNDVWQAKQNALESALKQLTIKQIINKLKGK